MNKLQILPIYCSKIGMQTNFLSSFERALRIAKAMPTPALCPDNSVVINPKL